jgi:hypothetical protein
VEIIQHIPPCLLTFAVRAVWLLLVPFILCFVASAIGVRVTFLQFGCFVTGFLLALLTPLPSVMCDSADKELLLFAGCYLAVLMLIIATARVMAKAPERRRQSAIVIIIFLLAALAHHAVSSRQVVL